MPVNQFDDNEFGWAADFNALPSALGGDAIISGCSISKGTGDWDIDVTSGQIIQGNTEAAISSGTVTITDSSGLTSGQSRVTLIHADTGDALASTDGTAATNPTSPDIPAGEVLLGFVVVADTDNTAADSDIVDVPALLGDDSARYNASGSHTLNVQDLGGGVSQGLVGARIYNLLDDWGDNKTTSRDSPGTTASEFNAGVVGELFRAEWIAKSGSLSASGSALTIPAGNSTRQTYVASLPGGLPSRFECTFTVQGATTGSGNSFIIAVANDPSDTAGRFNDAYQIGVKDTGDLDFHEVNASGVLGTNINSAWDDDTNQHTIAAERHGDEWELFYDAASQGTATDSSKQTVAYLGFQNEMDAGVNVSEVRVS